jgi:hypothetical protein
MIPRELLKKIRPSERRTNRRALRLGLRPQPRSVEGENQMVFWPALTCVLSPGRGFQPTAFSDYPTGRPANPVAGFSRGAAGVSPSPWGEGRDEGGQNCLNLTTSFRESINHWKRTAWDGLANDGNRFADDAAKLADDAANFADDRATVADDAARLANDRATVADDAARLANDPAAVADDAASFADGRASFADGAARFADSAAALAEQRDQFADDPAKIAEGRERVAQDAAHFAENLLPNADTAIFTAAGRSGGGGSKIQFSLP